MVLASGELVRVSGNQHPDLYWALRGGGNFGVATAFTFRLHQLDGVVAGPTFWDIEQAAEVLAAYRDFLPSAPRELNGFFVPPAPPFPPEIHVRKVCGMVWCYAGADEQQAQQAIAPLLGGAAATAATRTRAHAASGLAECLRRAYPPGDQWYWKADFFTHLPMRPWSSTPATARGCPP